jgi:hypothetical protein
MGGVMGTERGGRRCRCGAEGGELGGWEGRGHGESWWGRGVRGREGREVEEEMRRRGRGEGWAAGWWGK